MLLNIIRNHIVSIGTLKVKTWSRRHDQYLDSEIPFQATEQRRFTIYRKPKNLSFLKLRILLRTCKLRPKVYHLLILPWILALLNRADTLYF